MSRPKFLKTHPHTSGIIGGTSPQEMVNRLEHAPRENGQGFFLGTPARHQALIADPPFRANAHGDQGRQIEGVAQGAWAALGEPLLARIQNCA